MICYYTDFSGKDIVMWNLPKPCSITGLFVPCCTSAQHWIGSCWQTLYAMVLCCLGLHLVCSSYHFLPVKTLCLLLSLMYMFLSPVAFCIIKFHALSWWVPWLCCIVLGMFFPYPFCFNWYQALQLFTSLPLQVKTSWSSLSWLKWS